MSNNIRPINTDCITPDLVLEALAAGPKLKAVYVVAFEEDGQPSVYASGNLGSLCHAAILITDYATAHARGEIE